MISGQKQQEESDNGRQNSLWTSQWLQRVLTYHQGPLGLKCDVVLRSQVHRCLSVRQSDRLSTKRRQRRLAAIPATVIFTSVHRRRNRGVRGHGPPTFSLQGPCCFSPPQLEPKIKQLQQIHKPHVTFYMRKLYLMAAPSLMFHFLDSLRRSLLLATRFSA